MARTLTLERVELDEANAFVDRHHAHHDPVVGHLFSIGASYLGEIVGVAIVGRPVARELQDGVTCEITRLCTDRVPRVVRDRSGREHSLAISSFLENRAAAAAAALGFHRIGTYILKSESGVSLYAAGWRLVGETRGRSWSSPSRPRVDKHPTQDKLRFEINLRGGAHATALETAEPAPAIAPRADTASD